MAYFDLYKTLQDPTFQSRIKFKIKELNRLEKMRANGRDVGAGEIAGVMTEVLRMCNYNAALFVPMYFPGYLGYDENNRPVSLSLLNRPFTLDMYRLQMHGSTTVRGSRQLGKEQPHSAPVVTPNGWTTMGEIQPGDKVISETGYPVTVLDVFEQGVKDVYKVKFTDGSWAECGLEHLWKVKGSGCKRWTVRSLKDVLGLWGPTPKSDNAFRIPLTDPVQFKARKHLISPYVMGALLGDGDLSRFNRTTFTTDDPEILERVRAETKDYLWSKVHGEFEYQLRPNNGQEKICKFRNELGRLGLRETHSCNKHIPKEYLHDSVENRVELLRGLMDSDGSIYGPRTIELGTSSPQLADDLQELVESLGGSVVRGTKKTHYKTNTGERKQCRTSYRVRIRRLRINPFHLPRKAEKFRPIRYTNTRVMESIELVRREPSKCISVDSDAHTYLTRNFIVTHNTVTLGSRQRLYAHLLSGFKSIYIAPHMEHIKTYANKLQEMMRHFRYQDHDPRLRKNLMYKEFMNGAILEIARVYTSADEIRGKSTKELILDEHQHFDSTFYPEIDQLLRASPWKHILYSGTSLTVDTALEQRYQESSRGVWVIPCECGNWTNTGEVDECIKSIRVDGLTCDSCGRILDPTVGQWHHPFKDHLEAGHVGMHVPQIIIPDFVNDPLEWSILYRQFQQYKGGPKFIQEVLGIPTEEGSRELSEADLKRMCMIPDSPEQLKKKAQGGHYKYIISGCDWGGSEFLPEFSQRESLTVHAIIGVRNNGNADILHFRDYAGMGYHGIIKQILKDHFDFGGQAMSVDAGVGDAYIQYLLDSELPNDRLIIFRYNSNMTQIIKSTDSTHRTLRRFNLNRTETLTTLFDAIKRPDTLGGPRLRCYDYELAKRYLLQFLNLYRAPHEDVGSGIQRFLYRKHGSRPDDPLHAVNFALVLARVLMGEAIVADPKDRDTLLTSLRQSDLRRSGFIQNVGPGAG